MFDGAHTSRQIFVHKRAHEIRTLHKRSAQVIYGSAEACWRHVFALRDESRKRAQRAGTLEGVSWISKPNCGWESPVRYCSASINRVMVRFRSLSDRRISSILWIECSTVVWCLPPN